MSRWDTMKAQAASLRAVIPPEAQAALRAGVARGDAVAQLGDLGYPPRWINVLENYGNLITLAELLAVPKQRLLKLKGFGEKALQCLFDCLARYHELDAIAEFHEAEVNRLEHEFLEANHETCNAEGERPRRLHTRQKRTQHPAPLSMAGDDAGSDDSPEAAEAD